jgi:hypothetical protein
MTDIGYIFFVETQTDDCLKYGLLDTMADQELSRDGL